MATPGAAIPTNENVCYPISTSIRPCRDVDLQRVAKQPQPYIGTKQTAGAALWAASIACSYDEHLLLATAIITLVILGRLPHPIVSRH